MWPKAMKIENFIWVINQTFMNFLFLSSYYCFNLLQNDSACKNQLANTINRKGEGNERKHDYW